MSADELAPVEVYFSLKTEQRWVPDAAYPYIVSGWWIGWEVNLRMAGTWSLYVDSRPALEVPLGLPTNGIMQTRIWVLPRQVVQLKTIHNVFDPVVHFRAHLLTPHPFDAAVARMTKELDHD